MVRSGAKDLVFLKGGLIFPNNEILRCGAEGPERIRRAPAQNDTGPSLAVGFFSGFINLNTRTLISGLDGCPPSRKNLQKAWNVQVLNRLKSIFTSGSVFLSVPKKHALWFTETTL